MENPRTTTARATDDHELIDAAVADAAIATGSGSISGGNLARDIETQLEEVTISEPDARVRPQKDDDIHHGQRRAAGKPRDMTG
jgi:hypothetical protein